MGFEDGEQSRLSEEYQSDGQASDVPVHPSSCLLQWGLERSAALPGWSVDQALIALEDQDWSVRRAAARQLGRMGDWCAEDVLIVALSDEHQAVRSAAARALGHLGLPASDELDKPSPAIAPLIFALQDSAWQVRAAAAGALARLPNNAALEPLLVALHDEDESVRLAAATALGKLGPHAPLSALAAALGDPSWSVRESVVYALGASGCRAPIEPLLRVSRNDEDGAVREAAERILQHTHPEIFASSIDDFVSSALSWGHDRSDIQTGELVTDPGLDISVLATSSLWSSDDGLVIEQARPEKKLAMTSCRPTAAGASQSSHLPGQKKSPASSSQPIRRPPSRLRSLAGTLVAVLVVIALCTGFVELFGSRNTQTATGTFFRHTSSGGVSRVAWSVPAAGEDEQVAFAEADGMVQIYDTVSQQFMRDYGPYTILAMAWGEHGLRIASLAKDGSIQLLQLGDALNPNKVYPVMSSISVPDGVVSPVIAAWSTDTKRVALALNNSVQVWDIDSKNMITTHTGAGMITALAWSHTDTTLASAYDDGKSGHIEIWSANAGKSVTPTQEEPGQTVGFRVVAMAWSPTEDNMRLAYTLDDGEVQIWNRMVGMTDTLNNLDPNSLPARTYSSQKLHAALAWSPDGRRLASTTATGLIQVWDALNDNPLYTYTQHTHQINDMAWLSDGKRLVSVDASGSLLVWGVI